MEELLLKKVSERFKVNEESLGRIYRLLIVITAMFVVFFGGLLVYLILTSDKIAYLASFMLAILLSIVSFGAIAFVLFTPIVTWIWRGKVIFLNDEDSGTDYTEITTSILFFGFICLAVSIVIFYHVGIFVNPIDGFVSSINKTISRIISEF